MALTQALSGAILPTSLTQITFKIKLAARLFFKNFPKFNKIEFVPAKVQLCRAFYLSALSSENEWGWKLICMSVDVRARATTVTWIFFGENKKSQVWFSDNKANAECAKFNT